jgi:transposase
LRELKQRAPSVADTTDEANQPNNVIAHVEADSIPIVPQSPYERQGGTMEARQLKGLEIATNYVITSEGGVWIVPSQSSSKKYTVNLFIQTCTCADYEANRKKCKHIYAVEYLLQHDRGEPLPLTEKVAKPTYPQVWPAYNLAQTNEKAKFLQLLYDLTTNVEDIPRKPGAGRSRLPLGDMIFCVAFKVYSLFSGRRFISDLREAQQRGYISRTPHFNSIFNYLELEEMTPYLKQLIVESSLPLKAVEGNFAVDSSGFTTGRFIRWLSAKYTDPQIMEQQDWVKVHLMTGCDTNVVTSVEISGRHAGDSLYFKPLVEATAENFTMNTVCADKAYSSNQNLQLVLLKGAQPYIAFRSNATAGNRRSSSVWKRMYNFYQYNQEWFYEHYHKRSNVETTFSMIKAKFGERIRSQTKTAQINELLCKVLCHNLCCVIQSIYELGIDVDFTQILWPSEQSTLKGGDQQ